MAYSKADIETLTKFVREALIIYSELVRPDGPLSGTTTECGLRGITATTNMILKEKSLRDLLQALSYFDGHFQDLPESIRRQVDARLFAASGMTTKSARQGMVERGRRIFERGTIQSKEEFVDMDNYWNLLKDDNDPKAFEVEKFMWPYADEFDK